MKTTSPETLSEKEVIRRIRKGDERARAAFVKRNQGLVIYLAKKYAFSSDILGDLIAEGNMGLLKALEKYDVRRNIKFGTYAYFWIKRYVLRAVMKEFEIFKIPERIQEFKEDLEEKRRNYRLDTGRDPTDREIAREMKLPVKILKKLRRHSEHIRVISSDFSKGERTGSVFDLVDLRKTDEPEFEEVLRNRDLLEKIFNRLREENIRANVDLWLTVLKLHFGIENGIYHSYKEISRELGVSRQRVHQVVKICLKKLQSEWRKIKNEKRAESDQGNSRFSQEGYFV